MNILDIIAKKRDEKELNKEEIDYFINQYVEGKIEDYQAAALIMAIYINGMTNEETTNLAISMAYSGDVLDLSKFGDIVVDKHSTGGVGDKISLILLPIVASLGVKVAKMSGRGLGFTGGTADKLESIPGYRTQIEISEFIKNVEQIGISIITQTINIAPADKKIYALRDTISCVEKISLVASSIMSKKIASGANKIVLDVTIGSGAFMKTIESGRKLAKEMIEIGKLANKETICVLTNMDEPLGKAIGNNLEIIEAIKFLKGYEIEEDVKEVVLELGAYMMKLSGSECNEEKNKELILENIYNGKAYQKFLELVETQNGDISYIENIEKFEKSKYIEQVYSKEDGIIQSINAKEIGKLACYLGAGRIEKDDEIDYTVGIIINKKVANRVKKGEVLAYVHANDKIKLEEVKSKIIEIIKISNDPKQKLKTILEIVK